VTDPAFNRVLLLARHAHRELHDRSNDNGLSGKGWEQARALTRYVLKKFPNAKWEFLSSPKARCRETLEPLSIQQGSEVRINPLLDEQEGQSEALFKMRIQKFLEEWKKSANPYTLACSHGDWIPEFVYLAIGQHQDLKKGGVIWLELTAQKSLVAVEVHQELL